MPAFRIILKRALVALAVFALCPARPARPGHQAGAVGSAPATAARSGSAGADGRGARKQMAALPPDQRKMMESMMAQRGVVGGHRRRRRGDDEDLRHRERAERDVPQSTTAPTAKDHATRRKVITPVPGAQAAVTGRGRHHADQPQAYSMKMRMTTQRDGKPQTMSMSGGALAGSRNAGTSSRAPRRADAPLRGGAATTKASRSSTSTGAWSLGRSFLRGARSIVHASRSAAARR